MPTACAAPMRSNSSPSRWKPIVKGIDGVEHVYSQTEDDRVMVTARFLVGTKSEDAILRVHEKIRANLDRIPVGIPEPLIVGRGINDVAVTVLTLSPKPEAAERWTDKDLYELADKLRSELMKVDSIGLTYISGGGAQQIRVEPDPEKLSLFGVTLQQLVAKVKDANRSFLAGQVRDAGIVRSVVGGPDPGRHSRHRPAADLDAGRTPGLRQGRRQSSSSGPTRSSTGSGTMRATARASGSGFPRSAWRSPSARAPTRWWFRRISRTGSTG